MHLYSQSNIKFILVIIFYYNSITTNNWNNKIIFSCVKVNNPGSAGAAGLSQVQRVPITGAAAVAAPAEVQPEEEPLYVNAKQYHRILKRRQARAKLENDGRIPKERRVSFSLIAIIRK